MSPTSRTKQAAQKLGYTVAVVERWNPWARVRQDLFGFGDVLCMKRGQPLLLIQTTTTDHAASRMKKILDSTLSADWISTGNRIEVWSWAKRGERGKRKTWTLKVEPVTASR